MAGVQKVFRGQWRRITTAGRAALTALALTSSLALLAGLRDRPEVENAFAGLGPPSAMGSSRPDVEQLSKAQRGLATLRRAAKLYDMPVSNNGARVRFIAYAKGLDAAGLVAVEPPSALGGLKSPEYLALNPQGKMPLLVSDQGLKIYESDTIARYVLDVYSDRAPSFTPATPEGRALDNLILRIHDVYIVAVQGSMYKATPPFGPFQSRWEALAELKKQVHVIDGLASEAGPFLTGAEITHSDAALFPTMIFMQHMLPKFTPPGAQFSEVETFGPKLTKWWKHMTSGAVPAATRVLAEIQGALGKWDESGRWNSILYAGRQDTAERTIFDKIIKKEIPSDIVYEDDRCVVFKDIQPAAPVHMLVIPKRREGLTQLRHSVSDHEYVLGHLLRVAGEQGKKACGDGGFRIVINDGAEAGQSVFHLHIHIIGGRALTWPPG